MTKFRKLFAALRILLRKPFLLNLILENQRVYKEKVVAKYKLPEGLPQINISDLFPDMQETVSPFAFLDGSSLPIDLALLKALAKKYGVKDYLEIGTWRGESVANVASVVENCYTINLPDADILKLGGSQAYVDAHRFFSSQLTNVKHIAAHSHHFDFKNLNQKFDMVFVDGDHHYDAVKKDTQTAFDILKSDTSLIVWHDYAASPETIRYDVMMGILDGCPPEKRKHLYHVSNTLCAIYLNADVKSNPMQVYAKPDKCFSIEIRLKNPQT